MSVQQYEFIRKLDRGSFSKIKLAKDSDTGRKVAIKVLKKSLKYNNDDTIKREVAIMRSFRHSHIVRCYDLLQDDKCYYIIMEYIKGQNLIDYIVERAGPNHGLPEKQARRYFAQLVSAVSYCHSQFISHRDLKLENIMIDTREDAVKLIDFGLSARMHHDGRKHNTWCGSPLYAPPEICVHDTYTSPQVDIWSMGIILYAMLSGHLPFGGKDDGEIANSVYRCKYRIPESIPPLAKSLIKSILRKDPQDRATLEQIRAHLWLQPYGPIDLQIPRYQQTLSINLLIIEKMEQLGFNGDETMISLRHGDANEYTSVYHDLRERIYIQRAEQEDRMKIPYVSKDRRGNSEPDLRSSQELTGDSYTPVSPGLARSGKIRKNSTGQKFLQKLFEPA